MAYDNRKGRIKDIAKRFSNVQDISRFTALRMSAEFFQASNLDGKDSEGWNAYNDILEPINNTNSFTPEMIKHYVGRARTKLEEARKPVIELVVDNNREVA